jgi:hypothetical protein
MKTKTEKLTEQLQFLANRFYVLGVQYFEGIKGRDIPKWEDELQAAVDEYEDIRDEWVS